MKCILIGETEVGKTSLLMRFRDGSFRIGTEPTIGVDFIRWNIKIEGFKENLEILAWDTAGQEKYQCITRNYFKDIDACFLIFDITNRSSFERIPVWIRELDTYGCGNEVRILIGNKTDLL